MKCALLMSHLSLLCVLLEFVEQTDVENSRHFHDDKSNHIEEKASAIVKGEQMFICGRVRSQLVVYFRLED